MSFIFPNSNSPIKQPQIQWLQTSEYWLIFPIYRAQHITCQIRNRFPPFNKRAHQIKSTVMTSIGYSGQKNKTVATKESNGKGMLPAVRNRDDTGTIFSDLEEHGHRQIKMGSRRIAPPTIVAWESVVWRAEVGSSDKNRRTTRMTPSRIVGTLDFEAGSTAQPTVEQGRA